VHDPATLLYLADRGKVWVIEGDITRLEVDAIVSNDDVDGQMWTEVAHAIKRAAGDDIQRLAREGAPRKPGQAWITTAGDLPLEGVIHVASMNRLGESSLDIVQECLAAALERAVRARFRSVGIGAIGSGPKAIALPTWLRTFASVCVGHMHPDPTGDHAEGQLEILLILYEPENYDEAIRVLNRAVRDAWKKARKPSDGLPAAPPTNLRSRLFRRARVTWSAALRRIRAGSPIRARPSAPGGSEASDQADS